MENSDSTVSSVALVCFLGSFVINSHFSQSKGKLEKPSAKWRTASLLLKSAHAGVFLSICLPYNWCSLPCGNHGKSSNASSKSSLRFLAL